MTRLIPGVILIAALAACGSSGHSTAPSSPGTTSPAAAAAASPAPNPAASVLYGALSVHPAAWPSGVSNAPADLASYANGICSSIGKIALASLQAGQDAYRFAVVTYENKGYTLIQARAILNAIIYGYCPQWDMLTNTPAS